MTITFDQALGSNNLNNVGNTTIAITTGATAAAASRIVVIVSWFDSGAQTVTVSDGTAYTKDIQFNNGSDKIAVFSRVLVGSLASGSTITATWTAAFSGGMLIAACSYLGTTAFDTNANNATTGTSFSSGAASNAVADALFVGGAGAETTATSVGTTNTNGTPRFDIWNSAAQQGMRMLDKIASSIGSQALTGSWGATGTQSSTATSGALVIYKGTAGSVAAPTFVPSRMPLGA